MGNDRGDLRIYFCGSIRGGRSDVLIYKELIDFLKSFGRVLTEHVGEPSLTDEGHLPPAEIHARDLAWLRSADVVVAEVTTPSLGVGYELGKAVSLGKPVLCLFRRASGRSLSGMVSGSPGIQTVLYDEVAEAKEQIEKFIRLNSAGAALEAIPRLSIAPLRTPVERCLRLEEAVPGMPQLYLKRDDHIGPLVWGNKVRKLEYCFAEARLRGATTLITCGGIQSNHARITAQTAIRFGFKVILVLNGPRPLKPTGNLLVGHKLGVRIDYVGSREERAARMDQNQADLALQGEPAMVIPLGASDETGSLGFVRAAKELADQEQELGLRFNYLFHSTSSGGTQTGLEVGKRLFGLQANIIGVSADSSAEEIRATVARSSEPIFARLGSSVRIDPEEVRVETGFIGPGYGVPSAESLEAERIFAETEGILLDQTYTAKAAAALIAYARKGFFRPTDRVLFWHTGGTIALFQ
ncbi:MAG: pyridoxal-phosphate dependent enzyme [Bacteroidales bacterium]